MKSFAERTMTRIVTHPLFERAIVDARGDPESALPSTVEEMSSALKSVVEVGRTRRWARGGRTLERERALKLEMPRAANVVEDATRRWRERVENVSRVARAERRRARDCRPGSRSDDGVETDRLKDAFMLDVDASTGGARFARSRICGENPSRTSFEPPSRCDDMKTKITTSATSCDHNRRQRSWRRLFERDRRRTRDARRPPRLDTRSISPRR